MYYIFSYVCSRQQVFNSPKTRTSGWSEPLNCPKVHVWVECCTVSTQRWSSVLSLVYLWDRLQHPQHRMRSKEDKCSLKHNSLAAFAKFRIEKSKTVLYVCLSLYFQRWGHGCAHLLPHCFLHRYICKNFQACFSVGGSIKVAGDPDRTAQMFKHIFQSADSQRGYELYWVPFLAKLYLNFPQSFLVFEMVNVYIYIQFLLPFRVRFWGVV